MFSTDKPMSLFTKLVFWFVAIHAFAGAMSLIFFSGQTDTFFFWEIKPPLSAALFGALYLGGAAAVGWVSARGMWEPARFLIPILVSAGLLISLVTLLHLNKFGGGFKLFYWLLVYLGAPLLAGLIYVLQERGGANWTVTEPVRPVTRSLAVVGGTLITLAGLMIIIRPDLAVDNWPWPAAALMIRIFAAWFSAFGVGLVWFWIERDWRRVRHVADLMMAAAGLDLLMLVLHRADLTSFGPNLWLYVLHLALFGLLGLLMHGLQRRPLRSWDQSPQPQLLERSTENSGVK